MTSSHARYHQEGGSHQIGKGVAYLLLAWLMLTVVTTISRYASQEQPIPNVLFFQKLFSALCVVPWILKQGTESLKTKHFGLIAFRSVTGLLSFGFLFAAVKYTALVNAILLDNAAPLFIPLVVWFWVRVPIRALFWIPILLGFAGIACILKPGIGIINIGALFALGAALMDAMMMTSLRLLTSTEKNYTINFYYFLIGGVLCAPFAIGRWETPSLEVLLVLIAMGVFSAIGQFSFTKAFGYARPDQISSFNYVAVLYSALIDWIFFHQSPDLLSFVGILLICLGGIWVIQLYRK